MPPKKEELKRTRIWYQVEIYSITEAKWIPLLEPMRDEEKAREYLGDWVYDRIRISRVIETRQTVVELDARPAFRMRRKA